jgi:hypothetical protein
MRRSRPQTARRLLAVTAALTVSVLVVQAAPVHAGDVPPPYFVYGDAMVPPAGGLTSVVVAQRVDRPARTAYALTGGDLPSYGPSVSRDGRVLAFVRVRDVSRPSSARLVITVDGRSVLRVKDPASLMAVTPDGSAVTWVGTDGSVQAYRVATAEQVTLCDECAQDGSYAALSPDGRKIALRVPGTASNTSRVVIRRLSDSRVLARTPAKPDTFDPSVAWRPDSRQVAFSDQRSISGVGLSFAISTLTTRGAFGRTAFASGGELPVGEIPPAYVSPAWVDGAVWAVRLEFRAAESVHVVAVSAPTWKDTPVAGETLRITPATGAIVAGLGSWSTVRPVR